MKSITVKGDKIKLPNLHAEWPVIYQLIWWTILFVGKVYPNEDSIQVTITYKNLERVITFTSEYGRVTESDDDAALMVIMLRGILPRWLRWFVEREVVG